MKRLLFIAAFMMMLVVSAQDSCETALPITFGVHTVSSLDGEAPETFCMGNTNDVNFGEWYLFEPQEDGWVLLTTDLDQNTGDDTRIHVYTGNCNNLQCHASDDDSGSGYLSITTFEVEANQTYYIAFDDHWENNEFDFILQETQAPAQAPVTFTMQTVNGGSGYQNCAVDMNGDYLDDIVNVTNSVIEVLYQESDGQFAQMSYPHSSQYLPTWSIVAGDVNADGLNDLVLAAGNGASLLYSTGDGFTDETIHNSIFSQRSNMVDINQDGNLDIFICHDVAPNVYFLNDGENLTTYQGGLGDVSTGGNYGSIWTDYDNDGDIDMFIAKCRGGDSPANINELHRNNGDGTFTNVADMANMADDVQTWSSAWGDFDNDGDMDALVGANSFQNGGHKLMINNGDGTFSNMTAGSGFDASTSGGRDWVTHDFDNDGWLDVYGSGGKMFYNNGDGTFGAASVAMSHGAVADLNNDGFLDIYNAGNVLFNDANDNNWVKFALVGTESNINGIGARIEIYNMSGLQIREIRSGEGFEYMGSLNAHFGIGQETEVIEVIIKWPSGIVDTYQNIPINALFVATEGETLGVNEVATINKLSIYPNPATELVTINSNEIISENATILDSAGKMIRVKISNNQINVSRLPFGVYYLQLTDNKGKFYSEKLIIKR